MPLASKIIATAYVTIPGSVQRLQTLGYANSILMRDIWKFTQTASNADSNGNSANPTLVPVVHVARISDVNNIQ